MEYRARVEATGRVRGIRRLVRSIGVLTCSIVSTAVFAGCSLLAAPAPAPVTVTSSVGAAPAVPTPAARVRAGTPAPALRTTGTNWRQVVPGLIGYAQWLLANPAPGLAANVASPGCAFEQQLSDELQSLVSSSSHVRPASASLLSIVAAAPAGANDVDVSITATRGSEALLPTTSAPANYFSPGLPPTEFLTELVRGADQKWRICTMEPQGLTSTNESPSLV